MPSSAFRTSAERFNAASSRDNEVFKTLASSEDEAGIIHEYKNPTNIMKAMEALDIRCDVLRFDDLSTLFITLHE
jgi:hypothetical protein